MKHVILSFIAFIRHGLYVQIKQNGTHQSMIFNNIQARHDISQCSHNSRISILFFKICDKEINNHFGSVPLFKQFTYVHNAQFSMPQYISIYKYTQ